MAGITHSVTSSAAPRSGLIDSTAWNADHIIADLYVDTVVDGTWYEIPSLFRLRITGTGNVTMDSKNRLGAITLSTHSTSAVAATNQIEFPYAGDDAVQVRFTLTGSAAVEILK